MKLVPEQRELKSMSADDQAYWRGYFQGYAAREIQMSVKPKSFAEMTFKELVAATRGKSISELIAIFNECDQQRSRRVYPEMEGKSIVEKLEIMKARNAGQLPTRRGGGNHAA